MSNYSEKLKDETLIEVCDQCFCASCWHGDIMCDDAQSAGTTNKTVAELREIGRENPEYWQDQVDQGCNPQAEE